MTIDPVLMCARCQRPTLHIFVEQRLRRPLPAEPLCIDFVYVCDVCNARRKWGNARVRTDQGRPVPSIFTHAVDVHGMHRADCPSCKGVGLDCADCHDKGWVWAFDSMDPCGPACLLVGVLQAEHGDQS
jgi:hypothetical protein